MKERMLVLKSRKIISRHLSCHQRRNLSQSLLAMLMTPQQSPTQVKFTQKKWVALLISQRQCPCRCQRCEMRSFSSPRWSLSSQQIPWTRARQEGRALSMELPYGKTLQLLLRISALAMVVIKWQLGQRTNWSNKPALASTTPLTLKHSQWFPTSTKT